MFLPLSPVKRKGPFGYFCKEYCYAGAWSLYVNLSTGDTVQCYCSKYGQNIFENLNKPIEFVAIGECPDTHCFNGHMLLTLGCIPNFTDVRYGDIRDRERIDGAHWIRPEMKQFLNSKAEESNLLFDEKQKKQSYKKIKRYQRMTSIKKFVKKIIK